LEATLIPLVFISSPTRRTKKKTKKKATNITEDIPGHPKE